MFKCKIIKGNLFLGFGIIIKLDKVYDEYICGLSICNLFIGFISSEEVL